MIPFKFHATINRLDGLAASQLADANRVYGDLMARTSAFQEVVWRTDTPLIEETWSRFFDGFFRGVARVV